MEDFDNALDRTFLLGEPFEVYVSAFANVDTQRCFCMVKAVAVAEAELMDESRWVFTDIPIVTEPRKFDDN